MTIDQIVQEIKEKEGAEKAALEKEFQRIEAEQQKWRDARDAERRKNEAALIAAQEAEELKRRAKAEQELEAELRTSFFQANQNATEDDYQAVRDELRKQILLKRAEEERARARARSIDWHKANF